MAGKSFKEDDFVDITDVNCPVTFAKVNVALADLEDGEILRVHLNDGDPVKNVPRSLKGAGHELLELTDNQDGTFELYVRKGAGE